MSDAKKITPIRPDDIAGYVIQCHDGDARAAVRRYSAKSSICRSSCPLLSPSWEKDIRAGGRRTWIAT